MPPFAANVTMLFGEVCFGNRFGAAARVSFAGAGYLFPYDYDRRQVRALRDLTDDSGGRTEIISSGRDLDPATSSIANELNQQYYLGYPTGGKKDGRWHAIKVELRNCAYWVRARRGYIASTD